MFKLLVLIMGLLILLGLSVGCQQSGLTEEEIRNIVQEEVTRQVADISELTLSRLYITNDNGEVVAILGENEDQGGSLILNNADGERIVHLGADNINASLSFWSPNGPQRVSLSSWQGGSQLIMLNSEGMPVVIMNNGTSDGGTLTILGSDGQSRVNLWVWDGDGNGFAGIKNLHGDWIWQAP